MPYIHKSGYEAPFILRNGHAATFYAGAVKRTQPPDYRREKLELADGDFLLIDFLKQDPKKAVILCHGLSGHSKSNYNNTCALYFLRKGFSVYAWNNRGCGGEMNRLPQLYHHASISDLNAVVQAVISKGFMEVYLIGFSLGGAQILNYFGRKRIDAMVKAGVAVSTPIQLKSSAAQIEKGFNRIYLNRFLKRIKTKLMVKAQTFPDLLKIEKIKKIQTFEDLAKTFLVPVQGFQNLADYFQKASPGTSLEYVKTPVLLLNAQNDPILGKEAYPVDMAEKHDFLYLEMPEYGGHCAFPKSRSPYSYAEERAFDFFQQV